MLICHQGEDAAWGRIIMIAPTALNKGEGANVAIQCYALGRRLHPRWSMPVLHRVPEGEKESTLYIYGQVSITCKHN